MNMRWHLALFINSYLYGIVFKLSHDLLVNNKIIYLQSLAGQVCNSFLSLLVLCTWGNNRTGIAVNSENIS